MNPRMLAVAALAAGAVVAQPSTQARPTPPAARPVPNRDRDEARVLAHDSAYGTLGQRGRNERRAQTSKHARRNQRAALRKAANLRRNGGAA